MNTGAGEYPPQLAVGVTSSRLADASPAARAVHRAILRAFAATGQVPDAAALRGAAPAGHELGVLLAELHDRDVIRVDDRGRIQAAYPFSAVPTAHVLAIEDGPRVYAMCAIDALGISVMLGRACRITSADPTSGAHVDVTVDGMRADWRPDTAVVFVGADTAGSADNCCPPQPGDEPCTGAAADSCCGVMNFFTSSDTASAWLAAHPRVAGTVLTKEQALRLGIDIFGHLLDA